MTVSKLWQTIGGGLTAWGLYRLHPGLAYIAVGVAMMGIGIVGDCMAANATRRRTP